MTFAPDRITIGERIGALAAEHPDTLAIVSVAPDGTRRTLTWEHLERVTNVAARGLLERARTAGVSPAGPVGIALPSGLDHVIATLAAWKAGALVVPLNHEATETERAALRAKLAGGMLIGGREWDGEETATVAGGWWRDDDGLGDGPVEAAGVPRSASASGGSTGLPRIVIRRRPWVYDPERLLSDADRETGLRFGQAQLVTLPMYHAGFTGLHHGLVLDHTIVLLERFVPTLFAGLVEEFRVNCFRIVPTQMRMLLEVPAFAEADLTSIEAVHQGAGPCLVEVKRRWLELVPPKVVFEDYSSVERLGLVTIRGDEWLEHPGSVGRPTDCEVLVLRPDGTPAQTNEVGELYLRSATTAQPEYLGDGPPLRSHGDFLTLGDAGRIDEEGYLFLVGRTSDVLNVGGANVYPSEIEAVLLGHPAVRDAVVVGKPHEYLGEAVHALVAAADPQSPPDRWDLDAYCREHLSLAKVPLSYEFVDDVGRTSAGKLRRGAATGGAR
nr:AMP-binding protein [Dactylosporangium thailandense]